MKRLGLFVTVLVAAAALLAGCGEQLTAQGIVQHMRDTAANTTTAHVVLTAGGQMNGKAATALLGGTRLSDAKGDITLDVWYGKPNLVRAQVLAASDSRLVGAVALHDGTNVWAYDPHSKMAYKVDSAGLRQLGGKANIPANLQDFLANPNLASAIDQVLALTDYTLGPSEKIAGYQTYRLDLKPKANSPAAQIIPDGQATIWVDQATWTPVKVTAGASQGSFHLDVTTLDLNKPAPAGTFQFSLPQGGHVVDLTGVTPHTVTLAQARQDATAAGYYLLEPGTLPQGATLIQVMDSRGFMGHGASVTLNYSGGSTAPAFWISEVNGAGDTGKGDKSLGLLPAMPPAGEQAAAQAQTVTVRGVQGHLTMHTEQSSPTPTAVLWWKEAGTNLTVAVGGQASKDALLQVATGLK